MSLCVCGHFQLRENFYWVPARFYFLESSQQSFHLRVTVIPILQRRRLRETPRSGVPQWDHKACKRPYNPELPNSAAHVPNPLLCRAHSRRCTCFSWTWAGCVTFVILSSAMHTDLYQKKKKKKFFFFKWKYQSLFLAVSYNSLYVVFSSSFRKSFLSGGGEACSLY